MSQDYEACAASRGHRLCLGRCRKLRRHILRRLPRVSAVLPGLTRLVSFSADCPSIGLCSGRLARDHAGRKL